MICFHFSIFEPLETAFSTEAEREIELWFAFILVSLNHWKQLYRYILLFLYVVICFHFSIFEPLETARQIMTHWVHQLWFAFILVSLNHWKQRDDFGDVPYLVVICFHFSIFEPLETALEKVPRLSCQLWFAFILVSLNHWKQLASFISMASTRCDLLSF